MKTSTLCLGGRTYPSADSPSVFDDSYRLIPTAGWMFVPLTPYHKAGAEIVFEPLSEHYTEYEWALAQYLGAGLCAETTSCKVNACPSKLF